MKWRLTFFVTLKGERFGKTGLIGGDFSHMTKDAKPEHIYKDQTAAQQAADMINRRTTSFMCWPIQVEDKWPWNP
jgi:hypothetical protein